MHMHAAQLNMCKQREWSFSESLTPRRRFWVELVLHVKRGVDARIGTFGSYFILRVASVYVIDCRDWLQGDRSVGSIDVKMHQKD
jgi:hypothetical protein